MDLSNIAKDRLSARRRILQLGLASAASVSFVGCDALSTEPTGTDGEPTEKNTTKGKEAPALAELVKQEKLPPLEERLPKNPVVVEPVDRMGVYGGTWRGALPHDDFGWGRERTTGHYGMVRWDPEYRELLPDVAESFEINASADEVTLVLRAGMRWSDGEPFTARDVVFAVNDIESNPEINPVGAAKPDVAEALDDYTVRIKLGEPNGLYFHRLARPGAEPHAYAPFHYLKEFHPEYNPDIDAVVSEAGAADWVELMELKGGASYESCFENPELPTLAAWLLVKPVGAGGSQVTFERNPYFWKVDPDGSQLPYIDNVEFAVIDEPEVMLTSALNGDIDLHVRHFNNPQNKPVLARGREDGDFDFFETTLSYMNTTLVFLNLTHKDPVKREIFQNRDFRVGLSHAINRQEIIDVVFSGQGEPWQAAPLKVTKFYDEVLAKQYTEFDTNLANEFLDKAGYAERDGDGIRLGPDGKPISFVIDFSSFHQFWRDAIPMIRDYWRDLGLNVDVRSMDSSLSRERFEGNLHDANVWQGDGGMMDAFIAAQLYVPVNSIESRYAVLWAQWYESRGQTGEEPPADVQEQMALYDTLRATSDFEDQIGVLSEILHLAREQFYGIGVGTFGDGYGIVKNTFGNVPDHMPESYWYSTPGPSNPEQYFIQNT